MTIEILMPALSPTMEEGTLSKWLVKVGDKVSPGDLIAEIETDKATMEVESIYEGTIGKLLAKEGTEGIKVNSIIGIILEEGENEDELDLNITKDKKDEDMSIIDVKSKENENKLSKERDEKITSSNNEDISLNTSIQSKDNSNYNELTESNVYENKKESLF